MLQAVSTPKAPQAIGPYSQGMKINDFIFLSGQIPIDPLTNEVAAGGAALQTRQVMANIQAILASEDLTLENIIKTTIFIKDIKDFSVVNEEYANYLGSHRPARSAVEVSALPKAVLVEIEAIAVRF